SLTGMLESTGHLLKEGGINLAMKGVYPLAELDTLPEGFEVTSVEQLHIPQLDADRHVVIMQRK
ncbi:MAG: class I SAM-dependent methyltransferase, partial [Gammaproteobacteria bacterium]|nr:class I SAM-dependent methyltransferase [Gammaproteobacteria bacterium]